MYDSDASQEYYNTHSPPNHSYTPTGDSGDGYLQDYVNDYDNDHDYSGYGWNYDDKERRYYDDGSNYDQHSQAANSRHGYRIQGDSYERSFYQDASFEDRDYSFDDKGSNYHSREGDGYDDPYKMAEQSKYEQVYDDQEADESVQYGDGYHQQRQESHQYDDYSVSEEQYSNLYQQDSYVRDDKPQRDIYEAGDGRTKGRNADTTFNEYSFEDDQPYDSFERTEGSLDEYVKDAKGFVANSLIKDSGYHTYDQRVSEEIPFDQRTKLLLPAVGVIADEVLGDLSVHGGQLQERRSQNGSLSIQSQQEIRPSEGGLYEQSAYERKPSRTIEIYDQLQARQSSAAGLYGTLEDQAPAQSGLTSFEQRSSSFESRSNDATGFSQKVEPQSSCDPSPKQEPSSFDSVGFGLDEEALRENEQDADISGYFEIFATQHMCLCTVYLLSLNLNI